MTNDNGGGVPADSPREGRGGIDEVDALWEQLRAGLAAQLSTMVDPDEGDHLVIELPDPDPEGEGGCPPYAQFAAFGEGRRIRAELSGNAYLTPPYHLAEQACAELGQLGWSGNDEAEPNWYVEWPVTSAAAIAQHVVWALRRHFGIAHPQLLTYRAWGPAAAGAELLGLCSSDEVPTDQPLPPSTATHLAEADSKAERLALWPRDPGDLHRMVAAVLLEWGGTEPVTDADGDFVVEHLGQPVWVRVRGDHPAVEIVARVAHDVHSRRATAVEVGLLNRDNLWVRWTLRGRAVWQTLALPGLPFVPSHLGVMIGLFLEAMTSTRDDLAYRTGAKVA